MSIKPLGHRAYGSIGHLPNSRLGPSDSSVNEGQARICTEKSRDKLDLIIVQEKLDGACVSAARINGEIVALGRAGYLAESSPYEQVRMWGEWVHRNRSRFLDLLNDGERVCGEWLAQACGTIYDLTGHEPFFAFDILTLHRRLTFEEFSVRTMGLFETPRTLHIGGPLSVEAAHHAHKLNHLPCDEVEGVVYRVERKGKVDFLAKWVRPDKVDGKYLPEISGKEAIWQWSQLEGAL